jgi:nicotinate phosphoribosyltransferase
VEGPLAICQLIETTLLNLVNFPSLVATNAARMRLAAGQEKRLLEFGLRRAQGPDGGLSASKYSYLGGFDGTANVLAGKLFHIDVKGTHAHAYVMTHVSLADLKSRGLRAHSTNEEVDFVSLALEKRSLLGSEETNEGELAAFISYAQAFPSGFLALLDTYDTLSSGLPNFLATAWALHDCGYKAIGVRLDSGDLAYLSRCIRKAFRDLDQKVGQGEIFSSLNIVASNDINEDYILALNREGHEIDTFGIGTHLVTCQRQPALGGVYKLVEVNKRPRMKFSEDPEKMLIPGRKAIYRLLGQDNVPLVDLMQTAEEAPPTAGQRILVRHPFIENKRAYVTPSAVIALLQPVFVEGNALPPCSLAEARERCKKQLRGMRDDHIRHANPTPYKISVSQKLYDYIHDLWMSELPVKELS